jgi:hypothetical protein
VAGFSLKPEKDGPSALFARRSSAWRAYRRRNRRHSSLAPDSVDMLFSAEVLRAR